MKKLELSELPDWPRLMSGKVAAAYCGMSVPHFHKHFPIEPIMYGKLALYDKKTIDSIIDGTASGGDWTDLL